MTLEFKGIGVGSSIMDDIPIKLHGLPNSKRQASMGKTSHKTSSLKL